MDALSSGLSASLLAAIQASQPVDHVAPDQEAMTQEAGAVAEAMTQEAGAVAEAMTQEAEAEAGVIMAFNRSCDEHEHESNVSPKKTVEPQEGEYSHGHEESKQPTEAGDEAQSMDSTNEAVGTSSTSTKVGEFSQIFEVFWQLKCLRITFQPKQKASHSSHLGWALTGVTWDRNALSQMARLLAMAMQLCWLFGSRYQISG